MTATAREFPSHAEMFASDPKHMGFVLARYKFVAKMLRGYGRVLEIGCGDCEAAAVVGAEVGYLLGVDLMQPPIPRVPNMNAIRHDILKLPVSGQWDAAYSLDVLEHIPENDEDRFFRNIKATLRGPLIIGSPSLESQPYASESSKRHHCNCKTESDFRAALLRHFSNVFLFGMNDEVLHTGFGPMCHYRLGLCL